MKTWKKIYLGLVCAGSIVAGSLAYQFHKYETQRVPLEGKVIREFGKVEDMNYGFELISRNGNSAYIGIKYANDFCTAKGLALEQAIEEGSYVRMKRIRETSDKNKSIILEYAYPHEVDVIGKLVEENK